MGRKKKKYINNNNNKLDLYTNYHGINSRHHKCNMLQPQNFFVVRDIDVDQQLVKPVCC